MITGRHVRHWSRERITRRRRRRGPIALATVGVLIGLVAMAGCGGSGDTPGSAKTVLTIGWNAAPVSLDPAKDGGTFLSIRALSNEPLIKVKPDGSFGPGLATSWRYVGSDNKVFELVLREDAKFSNGEPVTARAVKAWLGYFASAEGIFSATVGPIRSIEATGETKVTIKLENSNPIMPLALSELNNWGAVSAPRAVADPGKLGTRTFGAGPYTLDSAETVTSQQYTYVPNKHYYNQGAIKFSKIVVKVIESPSSMLQAIQTGQLDVAAGHLSTAEAAEAAGLKVVALGNQYAGLLFADRAGTVAKPLADPRVRQALNYAIDRKAITSALFRKYGKTSAELAAIDGGESASADPYPHDPTKAKELLAAAGYGDGFALQALVFAGSGDVGEPVAQAMAKDLAAVGVDLQVTNATTPAEYVQKRSSLKYPLLQNTGGNLTTWQLVAMAFKAKGAALNPFAAEDKKLERLWSQGASSVDPAGSWREILDRIATEAYTLNVGSVPGIWYASKNVAGIAEAGPRPFPMATEWYFE